MSEINPWDVKIVPKVSTASVRKCTVQDKCILKLKQNQLCKTQSIVPSIHHNHINRLSLISSSSTTDGIDIGASSISNVSVQDKENTIPETMKHSANINSSLFSVSYNIANNARFENRHISKCGSFLGKPSDESVHCGVTQDAFTCITSEIEHKKVTELPNRILPSDAVPHVSGVLSTNDESSTDLNISHQPPVDNRVPSKVILKPHQTDTTHNDHSKPHANFISSSINLPFNKTRKCAPLPSQNYVKINLRKKCFSRKGSLRQRTLQRKVKCEKFKRRFLGKTANINGKNKCFRCGHSGHWANKCPAAISSAVEVDSHTNAAHMARLTGSWRIFTLSELDDRFSAPHFEDICSYSISNAKSSFRQSMLSVDILQSKVIDGLKEMGFSSFRPGQYVTILRTLLGVSTLAILPTAAGKSLCYQLPAKIMKELYGSVALVISPLISLMEDQTLRLFADIKGACLNSSQSMLVKEEILRDVHKGEYAFLLVSPEALVDSDWLLQPGRLPEISFVCIDEAHCLADWSHHFRPSYLRVCHLLRNCLQVNCFLALSATCTQSTIANVCKNLGITEANQISPDALDMASLLRPGYVQPSLSPIPAHLLITASMDGSRDEALVALLTRPPFNRLSGGILVYCATREQTERLASFIRTSLQEVVDQIGRRRLSWTTAAYHAGQSSLERSRIQKRFMSGRVRLLTATSAFGMGLNKPDLQVVIHYALTRSFENYIQEIGRVGRSQQTSYCHAFLPPALTLDPMREANEQRRHIFANHIDRVMLKRFLHALLVGVSCTCRDLPGTDGGACRGHVHAIDPQVITEQLDMKLESVTTLLAYLELETVKPLFKILHTGYMTAKIDCYGGPAELAYASQRCLAVAAGLALHTHAAPANQVTEMRQLTVDLAQLCNRWGWQPSAVRQELKALEWDSTAATSGGEPYRTGIVVSLSNWAHWIWFNAGQLPMSDERLDDCLAYLHSRLQAVELAGLDSVHRLTRAIASVAKERFDQVYPVVAGELPAEHMTSLGERSQVVHRQVEAHFQGSEEEAMSGSSVLAWPPAITETQIASVRSSIRDFISVYGASHNESLTGRTIANIFHGISTPHFPAHTWSRCHRFWRHHLDVDWPFIVKLATFALIEYLATS